LAPPAWSSLARAGLSFRGRGFRARSMQQLSRTISIAFSLLPRRLPRWLQ